MYKVVNTYCFTPYTLLHSRIVKRKLTNDFSGALNLRGIPRELLYRLKMAAAAEHRTVKNLLLDLIQGKIQELERKGLLPKGK